MRNKPAADKNKRLFYAYDQVDYLQIDAIPVINRSVIQNAKIM